MVLTDMVSSKMAKALNVDPSLVSRWRNGSRKPARHSDQMIRLSEYIATHMDSDRHVMLLSELMGEALIANASEGSDSIARAIYQWLNNEACHVFVPSVSTASKPFEKKPLPPKLMQSQAFAGRNGRRLVLERICHTLSAVQTAHSIRFYSGNPADWINADMQCRVDLSPTHPDWGENVEQARIIIHHNIKVGEMVKIIHYLLSFIQNATTQIVQIPHHRREIISNTIFITDVLGASSHGFVDSENYITNLYLDKRFIKGFAEDFDTLFAQCEPVHSVINDVEFWEMMEELDHMLSQKQTILFVGNTIPPVFLEPDLIQRLLKKAQIRPWADRNIPTAYVEKLKTFLQNQLYIINMPIFQPEEVEDGAMCITGIPRFLDGAPLIDLALYIEILTNLYRWLCDYPNVLVQPIRDFGHEHTVYIQKGTQVIVNRTREPYVSYKSGMHIIIDAFDTFAKKEYGAQMALLGQRSANMAMLKDHIDKLKAAKKKMR